MPWPGYRQQVLDAMPGTHDEIMRRAKVSTSCAYRWIHILHKAGQAHIGRWKRSSGGYSPVWRAGPGVDADCVLEALTPSEYSRNSRAKYRRLDAKDDEKSRKRAQEAVKTALSAPQTWLSALMPVSAGKSGATEKPAKQH